MDDPKNRGPQDRSRVNTEQDYEVSGFTSRERAAASPSWKCLTLAIRRSQTPWGIDLLGAFPIYLMP